MKKIIFSGIVLAILLAYLQLVAARELKIMALALAAILILALIGAIAFVLWRAYEKIRLIRAERMAAEKEAHVKIVAAGQQVFIRETNHRATWRAAHLDPRFYANGHYSDPTPAEIAAWQAFNRPQVIQQQAATMMMPGPAPIDLLAALDSVQRGLIVGASDTGKTTLLQWLVSRRLNTSKVIVIDPHAYPSKWPAGAIVLGAGRNYPEIGQALAVLVKLMSRRYDEIGRGLVAEMAHGRITILIDEWRAITGALGKPAGEAIKALLTESRKAAFSVFVASHSDRARPLGLEGEYDLKDGFAVVRLSMMNGQRTATLDTGSGEAPVIMPGIFLGRQPLVIDSNVSQGQEAIVLKLHKNGESISNIAEIVFGSKGGNQNARVKEILSRCKV